MKKIRNYQNNKNQRKRKKRMILMITQFPVLLMNSSLRFRFIKRQLLLNINKLLSNATVNGKTLIFLTLWAVLSKRNKIRDNFWMLCGNRRANLSNFQKSRSMYLIESSRMIFFKETLIKVQCCQYQLLLLSNQRN